MQSGNVNAVVLMDYRLLLLCVSVAILASEAHAVSFTSIRNFLFICLCFICKRQLTEAHHVNTDRAAFQGVVCLTRTHAGGGRVCWGVPSGGGFLALTGRRAGDSFL